MELLTLNYVWKQKVITVVLRRIGRGEKLRVRLSFSDDNRQWVLGLTAMTQRSSPMRSISS
jgi:hypothetical protein